MRNRWWSFKYMDAIVQVGKLGEDIWGQKWGQQDSRTAGGRNGGRWRRWLKTQLDLEKWSVADAPLGVQGISQVIQVTVQVTRILHVC